jgi:transcriptional regulator with XRE-family HTH domain
MGLKNYHEENIDRFGSYDDLVKLIAIKLSTLIVANKCEMKYLSNYTNISLSSLHKLKRGEGNPTISNIFKIANFFGVPIGFFFTVNELEISQTGLKSFSLYDLETYGMNPSKESMFLRRDEFSNIDYTIRINTTTYAPTYQSGVILYISEKAVINSGDIVFVSSKNGNALRRVLQISSENIYISIDSSSKVDDFQNLEIYGTVMGISV